MYDFVLNITFFGSLGIIVYLLARAVPRVPDSPEPERVRGAFDRLLRRLPLQRVDGWVSATLEKFLRKTRVAILKFDNFLHRSIDRVKKANGRANSSSLLRDKELFNNTNGTDQKKEQ